VTSSISLDFLSRVLSTALWPWWLSGAFVGLWLAPLAKIVPRKVLQRTQADLHEWQGPGGGAEQPVALSRRLWVPLLNASLWAAAAGAASHQTFWSALLWAVLASTLLSLALMDWDATLLPDWIVLPLGLLGLCGSAAGLTTQSLPASVLSAMIVLGLFGGLAWMFRRIRGVSGIGGGDLKLLAALATWWGVINVFYIVSLASVLTVVWYVAWRLFKKLAPEAEWPFGPAIVIASLAWGLPW
jgi:leader peptidase (prepilin peptidase)/N-methyltransferase